MVEFETTRVVVISVVVIDRDEDLWLIGCDQRRRQIRIRHSRRGEESGRDWYTLVVECYLFLSNLLFFNIFGYMFDLLTSV